MNEKTEKKKEQFGLKKLRNSQEKTPIHSCSNCKCNRYSPCTCKKRGE